MPAQRRTKKSVIFRAKTLAGRRRDLASRRGHLQVQPIVRRTSISAGSHHAATEAKLQYGRLCAQGWRTTIQLPMNTQRTPCGTRTHNLWIRGPTPCPLGQGGRCQGVPAQCAWCAAGEQNTEGHTDSDQPLCSAPARWAMNRVVSVARCARRRNRRGSPHPMGQSPPELAGDASARQLALLWEAPDSLALRACNNKISGHPESNQGPSDSCISLQSDALPTEL